MAVAEFVLTCATSTRCTDGILPATTSGAQRWAKEDLIDHSVEELGEIWSTNPLERVNKEIKRRTDVVGVFPNPRRPAASGRRRPG